MEPSDRLVQDVLPWMEKLGEFLPGLPRVSIHEGYAGNGVLGARAGPRECIEFDNVLHELAHGIEMWASNRPRVWQKKLGMRIKSHIEVAGHFYEEAFTTQASEREARVCGIQLRLLQAVDHPASKGFVKRHADMLCRWMPDWCLGGKGEEARLRHRSDLIREAYAQWPLERIQEAWPQVRELFSNAYQASLAPAPQAPVRKVRRAA